MINTVYLVSKTRNIIIILIVFISGVNCSSENEKIQDKENTLQQKYGPVVFANMLYRHGDRTIQESYPKDPHINSTYWKIGLGQLTKEGQKRQLELGRWIRKNYKGLLKDEYHVNDIYVMSSEVDRCLMSAQSNLAGLYPPINGSTLLFQPIPIHMLPRNNDNIIYMNASCPLYEYEAHTVKTSNKNEWYVKYQDLFKNLTSFTGKHIDSLDAVKLIYDTLRVEKEQYNLTLPKWANSLYPKILKEIALEAMLSHSHSLTMKKIKAGPILSDMVSHLVSKDNGTLNPNRKLWMYSGHDETMIALLHALDLHRYPITIPSYASLFVMELRKKSYKETFVTLKYKEGTNDTAIELRLEGCGEDACTLEKFVKLTERVRINNWTEDCALPQHLVIKAITAKDYTKYGWFFAGLIVISAMIGIYYSHKNVNKVKYRKVRSEFL